MDVWLVDRIGGQRLMSVEHPECVSIQMPMEPSAMAVAWNLNEVISPPPCHRIDFKPTHWIDANDRAILTPDGREDVPIHRFRGVVYRRGQRMWAQVWLSTQLCMLRDDEAVRYLAWTDALSTLRVLASAGDDDRIVRLSVERDREQECLKGPPDTRCYIVIAEPQMIVTAPGLAPPVDGRA